MHQWKHWKVSLLFVFVQSLYLWLFVYNLHWKSCESWHTKHLCIAWFVASCHKRALSLHECIQWPETQEIPNQEKYLFPGKPAKNRSLLLSVHCLTRLASTHESFSFTLNGFISLIIITPRKQHTMPHPPRKHVQYQLSVTCLSLMAIWNLKIYLNRWEDAPWLSSDVCDKTF